MRSMSVREGCGGARQSGADVLGIRRRASKIAEVREREVRDLPWRKYQTTVIVEYYRIRSLPQLRSRDRASAAVASEGALQQRFRGCCRIGLRWAAARLCDRVFLCGSRPDRGFGRIRLGSHRCGHQCLRRRYGVLLHKLQRQGGALKIPYRSDSGESAPPVRLWNLRIWLALDSSAFLTRSSGIDSTPSYRAGLQPPLRCYWAGIWRGLIYGSLATRNPCRGKFRNALTVLLPALHPIPSRNRFAGRPAGSLLSACVRRRRPSWVRPFRWNASIDPIGPGSGAQLSYLYLANIVSWRSGVIWSDSFDGPVFHSRNFPDPAFIGVVVLLRTRSAGGSHRRAAARSGINPEFLDCSPSCSRFHHEHEGGEDSPGLRRVHLQAKVPLVPVREFHTRASVWCSKRIFSSFRNARSRPSWTGPSLYVSSPMSATNEPAMTSTRGLAFSFLTITWISIR
jgi:hypothetical protein